MQGGSMMLANNMTNRAPLYPSFWSPLLAPPMYSDYQTSPYGNINALYNDPSSFNYAPYQGHQGSMPFHAQHNNHAYAAGPSTFPSDELSGIDFDTDYYSLNRYVAPPQTASFDPYSNNFLQTSPYDAQHHQYTQGMPAFQPPLFAPPTAHMTLGGFMTDSASTTPVTTPGDPEPDFFSLGAMNDPSYPQAAPAFYPPPTSNTYNTFDDLDYYYPPLPTFGGSTSPPFVGELGTIPLDGNIHRSPIPQRDVIPTSRMTSPLRLSSEESGFIVPQSTKAGPAKKESRVRPRRDKGKKSSEGSLDVKFVHATTESKGRALKRGRNSVEESEGSREAKRSRRETSSDGTATDNQSHTADQLSHAVSRGDGEATSHRRQVKRESTDTHVPEATTMISGASNQAGASTQKKYGSQAREKRRQEKEIIAGAIGKPSPDLRDLALSNRTLADLRDDVRKRQICLHSHDGRDHCGKDYHHGVVGDPQNYRAIHYANNHGCCCYTNLDPESTITCPQPGCGETVDRRWLEKHLQTNQHLLADMRFLRFVCPVMACPMKTIGYIPGSDWYHRELRKHKQQCSWDDDHADWKIVDGEPDLANYVV